MLNRMFISLLSHSMHTSFTSLSLLTQSHHVSPTLTHITFTQHTFIQHIHIDYTIMRIHSHVHTFLSILHTTPNAHSFIHISHHTIPYHTVYYVHNRAAFQQHLSTIFSIIFMRLQSCKTMKFIRSFLVFLCLFIGRHGANPVVEVIDSLQSKYVELNYIHLRVCMQVLTLYHSKFFLFFACFFYQ